MDSETQGRLTHTFYIVPLGLDMRQEPRQSGDCSLTVRIWVEMIDDRCSIMIRCGPRLRKCLDRLAQLIESFVGDLDLFHLI